MRRAAVTQGVVTPNMVAAIAGWSLMAAGSVVTMPQIAPAALLRILRETRFKPAMSTTEGIMQISFMPTYGLVSPEASVETINFGKPYGSARMAAVAMTVPAEPPKEATP